LREGAFLGVPAVNIGTRQSGREHGPNVVHVGYDSDEIEAVIRQQIAHGRYQRSTLFGDGRAGQRIADLLGESDLRVQKKLCYS
jgi:UDP-N-acetylglucosamine 2-epimerase